MTDPMPLLSTMRRPSLLIRAARFALAEYNRERDLRRIIRSPSALPPAQALKSLISEESRQEEKRVNGDAAYSATRHIDLLVALIAEARLVMRQARS